jgi:hypothetical protein
MYLELLVANNECEPVLEKTLCIHAKQTSSLGCCELTLRHIPSMDEKDKGMCLIMITSKLAQS